MASYFYYSTCIEKRLIPGESPKLSGSLLRLRRIDHLPFRFLQIHGLSSNLGFVTANNIGARLAHIMSPYKTQELIWASPREMLNIFHADEAGCRVITVTHDILKKLSLVGKKLDEYSLDTVKMFYEDAQKAECQL